MTDRPTPNGLRALAGRIEAKYHVYSDEASLLRSWADAMERRTHLGELDLEAFYLQAKNSYAWASVCGGSRQERECIHDLAKKLMSVIGSLRADGLDPKWHPEVDALTGITASGGLSFSHPQNVGYQGFVGENLAKELVKGLHQRGYEIKKVA